MVSRVGHLCHFTGEYLTTFLEASAVHCIVDDFLKSRSKVCICNVFLNKKKGKKLCRQ